MKSDTLASIRFHIPDERSSVLTNWSRCYRLLASGIGAQAAVSQWLQLLSQKRGHMLAFVSGQPLQRHLISAPMLGRASKWLHIN